MFRIFCSQSNVVQEVGAMICYRPDHRGPIICQFRTVHFLVNILVSGKISVSSLFVSLLELIVKLGSVGASRILLYEHCVLRCHGTISQILWFLIYVQKGGVLELYVYEYNTPLLAKGRSDSTYTEVDVVYESEHKKQQHLLQVKNDAIEGIAQVVISHVTMAAPGSGWDKTWLTDIWCSVVRLV
ncbi:hypothetical protein NQZ68_002853 [Dissostichus eleginoides]|nr:hypothetical protein NQZ68_002853 [Dissostichus eleginoides]